MPPRQYGFVYFLQCKGDGPIKIGFTVAHVARRIRSIQLASPYELEWIGYFKGTINDERGAHALLKHSRIRSEWFHPTQLVKDFISSKSPSFDAGVAIRDMFFTDVLEQIRIVIPRFGRRHSFYNFLDKLNVSVYDFCRWKDLSMVPERKMVAKVQKALKLYMAQSAVSSANDNTETTKPARKRRGNRQN